MPGRTMSRALPADTLGTETRGSENAQAQVEERCQEAVSHTGTGKILRNYAYKRHGMRKRPMDMKRATRGTTALSAADGRIVRKFLPYL